MISKLHALEFLWRSYHYHLPCCIVANLYYVSIAGVVEAVFLLLHLHLRDCADVDDCHAAGQYGQTLLQLLAVIFVRSRNDTSSIRIECSKTVFLHSYSRRNRFS